MNTGSTVPQMFRIILINWRCLFRVFLFTALHAPLRWQHVTCITRGLHSQGRYGPKRFCRVHSLPTHSPNPLYFVSVKCLHSVTESLGKLEAIMWFPYSTSRAIYTGDCIESARVCVYVSLYICVSHHPDIDDVLVRLASIPVYFIMNVLKTLR